MDPDKPSCSSSRDRRQYRAVILSGCFVIVVIDEMYDLMSGDANSIADSITKIVRDGKKAGIHIVIGSYRPSAKMIPGEIKVCIPCRVAFACTSSRESIMVLGQGGAETLSNLGDKPIIKGFQSFYTDKLVFD